MNAMPKTEGVGLMLNRKVGSKVIIMSNPNATDEEVLGAIKQGIVLTVVGVDNNTHYKRADGNSLNEDQSMYGAHSGQRSHKRTGVARIGIKAENALYIAREELLLRSRKEKDDIELS